MKKNFITGCLVAAGLQLLAQAPPVSPSMPARPVRTGSGVPPVPTPAGPTNLPAYTNPPSRPTVSAPVITNKPAVPSPSMSGPPMPFTLKPSASAKTNVPPVPGLVLPGAPTSTVTAGRSPAATVTNPPVPAVPPVPLPSLPTPGTPTAATTNPPTPSLPVPSLTKTSAVAVATNLAAPAVPPTPTPGVATQSVVAPSVPVITIPPGPSAPTPAAPTAAVPPTPTPGIPPGPAPGAPPLPGTAPAAPSPPSPLVVNTATSPAFAKTNAPGEEVPEVQFTFQATDLKDVLVIYEDLVKRTLLRPAALPEQKITLKTHTKLTRSEAIRALSTVLAMNSITLIEVGDKFVKVVPENLAFQQAKPFTQGEEIPGMPEMSPFLTYVRQLTNAKPSEVVQALTTFAKMPNAVSPIDSCQILVLRDYTDNVKRMLEMLDRIDVAIPLEVEPVVIPIKYALANDIAQVLGSLSPSGGGTSVGGSTTARRGLSGPGAGTRPFGSQGTMPGQPGYQQPGGITPGTTPGAAQSSFAERLKGIVARATAQGEFQVLGQVKIIADERTNSLLIFADKRDLAMITNIIAKLDVVLAQVLIEALIMDVKLGDSWNYGVSYQQRQPTKVGNLTSIGSIINGSVLNPGSFAPTTGTNAGGALPGGFSYFGRFGNDLDVTFTAVAEDSRVNVLSKPRILTSHAKEASIFVGETRPYITSTYAGYGGYGGGGYPGYSQYQQLQIGINLSVLPFINAEGLVVMDIRQRIQSIGREVKIDNNMVPTTIDREATAYIAVRDRDTVVLGGFITSDQSKTYSGVPLLKDIPVLGNLFKSSDIKNNRGELIVLIRPTVLPTPEAAAAATVAEREQMPGIQQAEKEAEDLALKEKRAYERWEQERQKKEKKAREKKGATKLNGRTNEE